MQSECVAVTAGSVHSIALIREGFLLAWGYNGSGAIGTGDTIDVHSPVPIVDLTLGSATMTPDSARTAIRRSHPRGDSEGEATVDRRRIRTA